jgi:hypothetical protein
MTINRHNYEEYFLLYTDGELSPQLQQEVEQFAAQHPDLASELKMLLDTKLPADDGLLFFDKASLLKPLGESISTENYQEKFLLYVDNELSETAKAETERFVLQHPQLQEAFTQIIQTKLEPEIIPHPDKASLYRQEEEEEKPVIFIRWTRMLAVAAIFMGLAIGLWNFWPAPQKVIPATNPVTAGTNTKIPNTQPRQATAFNTTTETAVSAPEHMLGQAENANTISTNTVANPIEKNNQPSNATYSTAAVTGNNATNNKDNAFTNDELMQIAQHKTQQAVAINNNALNPAKVSIDAPPTVAVVTASLNASSKPAYKQLDTDEDEQEVEQQKAKSKPLYIASVAVNKEEVNTFVDKAKKIFGKSAEQEDKVAIASFALSKKSLR